MTTTEPSNTEDDQVATAAPEIDSAATDQAPEVDTGDKEQHGDAARYRRQLKDTKIERDDLRTKVDALQRTEVERLAGADRGLQKPAALWAIGTQLADLIADDGTVDAAKVQTAVTHAIDELGFAVRRDLKSDPSQGARGGGDGGISWATALRG